MVAEGSPEEAMMGYRMLSIQFYISNMDSARWYSNKYRALARKQNSVEDQVQSYRLDAQFFLHEGNLEAALETLQEAWKVAGEGEDGNIKAGLLGTIAGIYSNAGFYQAARKYLKDQLDIAYQDSSNYRELFGVVTTLGVTTMELANQVPEMMDSVEGYFKEALEVSKQFEGKGEEYIAYDYLGEFELKRGDPSAAKAYFEKEYNSWEAFTPENPRSELHLVFQGRAAYGLAKTYQVLGNSAMVLEYCAKAREVWGRIERDLQERKLAKLKMLEAGSYLAQGERELAAQAVEEGIELAEKINRNNNSDFSEIYNQAALLMSKLGAYEESNALFQKYIELENEKKLKADRWAFFSNHSDLMNQVLELNLEQEKLAAEQARKDRNLALASTTVVLTLSLLILFLYRNLRKSDRLNQAYAKELVELNETRERLISILGHDLRGPFQSIMLMSQKSQSDLGKMETDQVKGAFKVIEESSREMYFLFENLLEWARSQSGTLPYQPEEIDLREVLQETKIALQSMTESNGISIRVELDSSHVVGDPFMVRTIFRNLLGNAIRHSQQGSVIEVVSECNKDGMASISVVDQGEGIDEQTLAMLNGEVHHSVGKQGLGLVLCRDFLDLHGSRLKIQSELGKGSRFSFELDAGNQGEAYYEVLQDKSISQASCADLGIPELGIPSHRELSTEFQDLKVYQTSRAHGLLAALEKAGMAASAEWKVRFLRALKEFDEEEFGQLMALLFAASKAVHDPIGK